jgi:hypothetical protein
VVISAWTMAIRSVIGFLLRVDFSFRRRCFVGCAGPGAFQEASS